MQNPMISQMVKNLVDLNIFKGIQPSELADAIFEESYIGMVSKKILGKIEVTITFNEICDITQKIYTHNMRYTYDSNCYLLRIEQSVNSKKFNIVWDRYSTIESAINELKIALQKSKCSIQEINKIIATLPTNFRSHYNSMRLEIAS